MALREETLGQDRLAKESIEAKPRQGDKEEKVPEGWSLTGEETASGKPIVSNGKERRILANNGLLRCDGNPGNAGGGRIAEKVRLDATKGLESEVTRIGSLLTVLLTRAESELGSEGNVATGLATVREIGRIASTLTAIGPGTRQVNEIDDDRFIDLANEAYTSVHGEGSEGHVQYLKELRRLIKG